MKKLSHTLILFLILGYWPISADSNSLEALPMIVSSEWDDTEMIGHTTLRKFGFHIYDASYWNLEKTQKNNLLNSNALMIVYARNIAAEKLVNSTKKQWKKIGISKQFQTEPWLEELTEIWPSIKKGDILIALVTPEGPTLFYSGTEMLGEIQDPDFGPAFLDIWLSPETNYKKNRKELLNEN